jgi:calmodulin
LERGKSQSEDLPQDKTGTRKGKGEKKTIRKETKREKRQLSTRSAPPPESLFTQEQIAEYKETFDIFDRDLDGKVTQQEMDMLVNTVGFQPGENELDRLCSRIDKLGSGKFNFDEFLLIAEYFDKQINIEQILASCFEVFFGDDPRAKVETTRDILMNYGNPLTDAELKQLFWNLDPEGNDLYKIADIVKLIVGKKEEETEDG